jgi:hypothetical protein
MAPNIHECLCDTVTVTTGLESLSIHDTFLTRESKKKNNDSSTDTTVNPFAILSKIS